MPPPGDRPAGGEITRKEALAENNEQRESGRGAQAERLGSIERVTAERHGAIRVDTPAELAQVARIFGAMGMHPTDPRELARTPFRVFTSLLATGDRRFFDADLAARLESFLARRQLFQPRLLELADLAEAEGGLPADTAAEFLSLATASFAPTGWPGCCTGRCPTRTTSTKPGAGPPSARRSPSSISAALCDQHLRDQRDLDRAAPSAAKSSTRYQSS